MVNYACAFSQSESGKYFEWIIRYINEVITLCRIEREIYFLRFPENQLVPNDDSSKNVPLWLEGLTGLILEGPKQTVSSDWESLVS